MRMLIACISALILLGSCPRSQSRHITIPIGSKKAPLPNEGVATFAEGSFWHSEIVFQSLLGVRDAVSGYAGGIESDPTYEKVSTGKTGHAETVQVYYDPFTVSYETLVKAFFLRVMIQHR